jgi:dethiobiotin synthetase
LRGVFVTGTDTEVGKSVVAAAICAALVARGETVAAFKPAVTGLDEEPGRFGRDHELLASVANAGQTPEDVAPYRFGPAVSPHFAAELAAKGGSAAGGAAAGGAAAGEASRGIEPAELVAAARAHELLVCEGVGGLLVPITPGYLVRDLAVDLGLPVVVAARTGLGTINHTLLTVEAARAAGLRVAGVVMTPWPRDPVPIERSNRATVERLAGIAVSKLPRVTPDRLAEAGAGLPLDDWL